MVSASTQNASSVKMEAGLSFTGATGPGDMDLVETSGKVPNLGLF